MEILIISPKWEKYRHWPYYMPLLGPLTVAGITPPSHNVTYVDENTTEIDFDAAPDLAVISAMTAQARRGYEIADEFRKKGIKVVMGGLHASLMPDEALQHADVVAAGEAEELWSLILDDFSASQQRPLYLQEEFADLSCGRWASARRDLINPQGYTKTPEGRRVLEPVQAGRGCTRNCEHCNVSLINGTRFRTRPLNDIVREIRRIESEYLFFVDDALPDQRKFFTELFQLMKPLNRRWISVGGLNLAEHPEYLKLIRESGCRALYIGFDRLSTHWRREDAAYAAHELYRLDLKKHDVAVRRDFIVNRKKCLDAVNRIRDEGIAVIGTFAFGFDQDDESVFEETLEFLTKADVELADFAVLTPYPKSPLAVRLQKENRILHYNWKLYNGCHAVFRPKNMSPERLEEKTEWVWNCFNEKKSIFRRMIETFRR